MRFLSRAPVFVCLDIDGDLLLQIDPTEKLICLPTEAFDGVSPVASEASWSTSTPVHLLLCRFFNFIVTEFQWGSEVASVRIGTRRFSNDARFQQLPGRGIPRLHIEDPFLLGRNLNCTLSTEMELTLRTKLRDAWVVLQSGWTPNGLRQGSRAPMQSGKMQEHQSARARLHQGNKIIVARHCSCQQEQSSSKQLPSETSSTTRVESPRSSSQSNLSEKDHHGERRDHDFAECDLDEAIQAEVISPALLWLGGSESKTDDEPKAIFQ